MRCAMLIERNGALKTLLHWVVLGTPQDALLFLHSLADDRRKLKLVDEKVQLDVHWAPHSARAGFASDAVARGVPFQEIKEQRRWITVSSLRIYVDVVTASSPGPGRPARNRTPCARGAREA